MFSLCKQLIHVAKGRWEQSQNQKRISLANNMLGIAREGQKSILMSLSTSQVNTISCKIFYLQICTCKAKVLWAGMSGCALTEGPHGALKVLSAGMCSHNIPTLYQEEAPVWSQSTVYTPRTVFKSKSLLGAHLCEAAFQNWILLHE